MVCVERLGELQDSVGSVGRLGEFQDSVVSVGSLGEFQDLSLIHISEPTRR